MFGLPLYRFSKSATLGQYLSGSITYAKDELAKKVCFYPFRYVLSEAPKKTSSSANANSSNNNNNNNNNNNGNACSAANAASSTASSNGDAPATAAASASAPPPAKDADSEKATKTKYDEYLEAVRDLKTSWLSKLGKLR